jgi:hypothetical protein
MDVENNDITASCLNLLLYYCTVMSIFLFMLHCCRIYCHVIYIEKGKVIFSVFHLNVSSLNSKHRELSIFTAG